MKKLFILLLMIGLSFGSNAMGLPNNVYVQKRIESSKVQKGDFRICIKEENTILAENFSNKLEANQKDKNQLSLFEGFFKFILQLFSRTASTI